MAEKTFLSYLVENKKEYKYVLKFAVENMTDEMIDCLENCLAKYDLKQASSFRKTPIQENPLDFPQVKNMPVFISDLTLGYPGSLDFLRNYICGCMGIPLSQLVVYSENDPRQIETDLYVERTSEEYKKKYQTRLGSEYPDDEKAPYGEKYNVDFLKELERIRKEREAVVVENPLSPKMDTDRSDLPNDYDSFNDEKNLKKEDLGLFGRIKKPNLLKVGKL